MRTNPPVRHRSRASSSAAEGASLRHDLTIEWRQVETLTPSARNARTHSEKQIAKIAASIAQFGFTNPILIDAEGAVIAGHGRLAAARSLGRAEVPTIRLDQLSEAQKRAYAIADNRLAELAGWDKELLAIELQYLSELEVDLDIDVEITGFDTAAIDLIIGGPAPTPKSDPADRMPAWDQGPPVSQRGDLWLLGEHRLFCGDALQPESFAALLGGKTAQMVFTDPPYNVPIDGHVGGLGRVRHDEFVMAAGEMSETEFTGFLQTALGNLAAVSQDGAIHFVCMDWRHIRELITAGRPVYGEPKNLCVWNKDNGGMGSFYRSKHELVFVFKVGGGPHINNFELGQHGRYRTNVWEYAGISSLRPDRMSELAMHPTVKPVALVADAIKDCSKRRGIIVDAFTGSGTTLIAAAKTGRVGYGLELDPRYVDVAVKRWQQFAKAAAIHAETGSTFDVLASQRATARPDPTTEVGHAA